MENKVLTTRKIAIIGMLTALIIVLGLSGLGIIEIPGLPFRITILHIPVIIGAILEGPIVGGLIGLLFGIWSIIDKVMRPTATGFVFFNPLVSVLPRILIGVVAYYVYAAARKRFGTGTSAFLSAIFGTVTNTVGVLGMIYIVFAETYMQTINKPPETALPFLSGVAVTNGTPEVIASAIIVPLIVLGVLKLVKK